MGYTYTTLVQAIQDWMQQNDATFVSNIPLFVQQAEARLYRELRSPDERQSYTSGILSASTNVFTAPVHLIGVNSFYASASTDPTNALIPLFQKELSYINEAYPANSTFGPPRYYALTGAAVDSLQNPTATFTIGPYADVNYKMWLYYFGRPESIMTAGTSWYGTECPDALLYSSLAEAYSFQKGEPDMVQLFREKAAEAMLSVQRMVEGIQKQDTFRNDDIRRPINGPIAVSSGGQGQQ